MYHLKYSFMIELSNVNTLHVRGLIKYAIT